MEEGAKRIGVVAEGGPREADDQEVGLVFFKGQAHVRHRPDPGAVALQGGGHRS